MGAQMSGAMQGGGGFNPQTGMQGGGPPPPPAQAPSYHYSGPDGQSQGLTAAQVAAKVQAQPSGKHHVWQTGWPGWKGADEVPEIASQLGPPPPPPQ